MGPSGCHFKYDLGRISDTSILHLFDIELNFEIKQFLKFWVFVWLLKTTKVYFDRTDAGGVCFIKKGWSFSNDEKCEDHIPAQKSTAKKYAFSFPATPS